MGKALVYKSTGNWYKIKNEQNQILEARLRGKFRNHNIKHTNPIAVGDWVEFDLNDDGTATIHTIKQRNNYLIRKSVNLSKSTHIIASNIDQLWLMVTLSNPRTSTGFIDRVLVTASAYQIPVCILFNKIDEYQPSDLEKMSSYQKIYQPIGYDFLEISAFNQQNINQLKTLMSGKVNLVAGHSGVGKSTLLNGLHPDIQAKTSVVSGYNDKGKHTTTHAQMYDLPFGGQLIDTPGIKEFGLVDMNMHEVQNYFPEIFNLKSECKFHNCLHKNEPKCAVIESVKTGKINNNRYLSYLGFLDDMNEK